MPRTTKEHSDATAARILRVGLEAFTERGVAAVTLEEVAGEAGVTRGAVYHHYGSKKGLFEAVLRAAQEQVAEQVERAATGAEDPWSALEAGCRAFLEASTRSDLQRVMLVDGPSVLGWAAWRHHDDATSGALLREALEELTRAGVVSVPPGAAAALLSGAMNEAALWVAGARDRAVALEEAWRTLRPMLASLRSGAGRLG